MKKTLLLMAFLTFMIGCQKQNAPSQDVQVVKIEVTEEGYSPSNVEIKAGKPIKFVVTRHIDSDCAAQIISESLGIKATDLPLNKPVEISVPAQKAGYYRFACGMNMLQGMLVVKA
jgi:Cu(I)/Ag(I) efflux system membrane fusion protein